MSREDADWDVAYGGLPAPLPDFDGHTYSHALDYKRLGAQAKAVFDLMRDGQWRALYEISAITNYPEASVSARLRDFRKEKFGMNIVQHRRRYIRGSLWEYRLLVTAAVEGDE